MSAPLAGSGQDQPVNDVFKISNSTNVMVTGHALNRFAVAADDVVVGRVSQIVAISFSNRFTPDNPRFLKRLEVAVNGH